ncbi:metal-dependent protein hydrolase [Mycena sanguinolenta]|nr:metal-dependent protein hydrolase [Mycena sanguinolenta]
MFAALRVTCTRTIPRIPYPHSFVLARPYYPRAMSSSTPQAKKQKLDQTKVIGTHNGTFHCDEALAVFLLRQTATYHDSEVRRTRDPAILDTCDIVVDVGAVYDESKQLFDHHQRGFTEVFGHGFETKLSSAGLVYKHFGKEVIANKTQLPVDDPKVTTLWLKMYKQFIEAIDAIDNGISQYPSDIKPKYKSSTDLSSRVGGLNPVWNQPSSPEIYDAQFAKASQLTGEEFVAKLSYYANAWLPAQELLDTFVASSKDVDPTGKILVFEQFFPWKEHLYDHEADSKTPESEKAIYTVYPDDNGNWRVQAVAVSSDSFDSRKALPEAWRGLRDDTLSVATGIEGCVFVHASGFIGGTKTKEGALRLARAALEM